MYFDLQQKGSDCQTLFVIPVTVILFILRFYQGRAIINDIRTILLRNGGQTKIMQEKSNVRLVENKIKLGIVGTGRIADRFINEVRFVEGIEIAAVYNPNAESVKKFAHHHKIALYTDNYDRLLKEIDAVYIASPHGTHFEYAKNALLNGIHVLCEKPMVLKKVHMEVLMSLADRNGCVLLEGVKCLYAPGFQKVLELAASGTIGTIYDVEACFTKLSPENARELQPGEESGSFLELGSYVLCAVLSCLGTNYESVQFESIRDKNQVDIYTKAYFKYKNAFAAVKVGLGVKSEGELLISGTKGYILVQAPWWKTSVIEIRRENPNDNQKIQIPFEGEGLRYELKEFVQRIRSRENAEQTEGEKQLLLQMAECMERFRGKKQIPLKVREGATIYSSTGRIGYGQPDRMSSIHYYKAYSGCRLHLKDASYYYNVATYALRFDEKYIYTYDYEPEESWTTYRHDLYGDTYIQNDYIFHDKCYFRICLKKKDGSSFSSEEAGRINEIIEYEMSDCENASNSCFRKEIERVTNEIQSKRKKEQLLLAVLTDSHFTVNGTWEETVSNLQAVNENVRFDAIIHLGDWTDGMVPMEITKDYVESMKTGLGKCGCPLYSALGNHDSNYFRDNQERMTFEEQISLYMPFDVQMPYYFKDFAEYNLRCIFLASFDPDEQIRYGFWSGELEWLDKTLENTPRDWCVIVFSHDAPVAELDYWADEIRNGELLVEILEAYQNKTKGSLLAYIHGHTHADYIDSKRNFPVVSVGCAKCESFKEFKPEGAVCHCRKIGTVSQDLWDALLVDTKDKQLQFIRFGAGKNRCTGSNTVEIN